MKFWNKLVGFGKISAPPCPNRVFGRPRRHKTDSFSFATLEPRQLLAIDLVADLSPTPARSDPHEIVEVPGKGMALVAPQIINSNSLPLTLREYVRSTNSIPNPFNQVNWRTTKTLPVKTGSISPEPTDRMAWNCTE